jgi:putative transposase
MRQRYPGYGIGIICGLFGKTRQALYKQQHAEDRLVMKNAIIIKEVKGIRCDLPRTGTRKLYFLLAPVLELHGISIGRDSLFDLLSDYGLLVRKRKRRKVFTTDSNHPFRKYPNLIKDLDIPRPQRLWVSDITYIRQSPGFCYLSLVTDAYSRKIVGHCLYPTLEKHGPLAALDTALLSRSSSEGGLIHHSDRGLQYCCNDYTSLLTQNNVLISMTEKGDPYENAIAERVNGVLKAEFELDRSFKSFDEAATACSRAIRLYNEVRPHGSCNYLTPAQAHLVQGTLTPRWKKKTIINHAP